ncbi:MAG TPA: ABC transporter substrate-binding protein [Chloroflexota bacterium]|nr:ABC transporter substrate-binding protein [Chloroflexota bacterium]
MRASIAIGALLTMLLAACGSVAAPAASSLAPSAPAASAAASAAPSAAPTTKLSVVYSALSPSYLALWAAQDAGYFQKNGLAMDVQLTNGGSPAMAVLLSGQAQIFQAAGSDILSAVAGGTDLLVTATTSPVYPFKVEVTPDIKAPADLKGKKVAITSLGDTSDMALRLSLQKLGLDPEHDVTAVTVGSSQNGVAALLGGAVDAALLSPPQNLTVEAKGFHALFDVPSVKLAVANQEIAGQRSWITGHRDLMQKYVDAIVEATARVKQDKPFSIGLMKKYLKSDDEQALSASYDFSAQLVLQPLPFPTAEQFNNTLSILSQRNDKLRGLDVSKLLDPSFVQSAADRHLDRV